MWLKDNPFAQQVKINPNRELMKQLNSFVKKEFFYLLIMLDTSTFRGFKFYYRYKRKYPKRYRSGYEVQLTCKNIDDLLTILHRLGFDLEEVEGGYVVKALGV
jgi:hypothetical protein